MLTESLPFEPAACRSLAYRFLATLFLNRPEPTWLAEIAQQGLLAEFPVRVGNGRMAEGLALMAQACGELADGAEAGKALCWEYDRLFVGMGHVPAPPWESVYRSDERMLFDWPTLQVRAAYRAMGLEVGRPEEPDDHIGLELLFMAELCEREARGSVEVRGVQHEFLSSHLMQWAPAFCEDILANTQVAFYRGLALLTQGLLEQERECLAV